MGPSVQGAALFCLSFQPAADGDLQNVIPRLPRTRVSAGKYWHPHYANTDVIFKNFFHPLFSDAIAGS